jgi:hypothetical protein
MTSSSCSRRLSNLLPLTMPMTWQPGSSQRPNRTGSEELVAVITICTPRTHCSALSTAVARDNPSV